MTQNSESKTVIAKFFRTFRNAAAEGFRQSSGYFGQCLDYVEYETDLPDDPNTEDICTYSAVNCLGQASMKGYATGNTPRVGAIVIYKQGDDAMNNGHAGIVASINQGSGTMIIHDSNWSDPPDGIVRDCTVNISDAGIMGYIYPTP
ncbi:MAG: CHAP domain-containing protein [Candidatus Moranbacteria bacterium]|jgi:surface antigen|nr:CHAP domain-containing protein [Candidatus Moranbacteria bacterium]